MAGAGDLSSAVRKALRELPPGGLERAADLADEARQALTRLGSEQSEVRQAVAGFERVAAGASALRQVVDCAAGLLTGYLDRLGVSEPPPAGAGTAVGPVPSTAAGKPAVSPYRQHGAKTHGRWVDEHGRTHEIVSGLDDSAEAVRLLREHGIPPRGHLAATADVEQKPAARMVHAPNYRKTFTGGAKPWSR
ncbi:DddA-like double-stranded DNA deaminase toxin [Amycolatopsis sp. cmx-8-4]|uniref:DddA-like double-stranded DNA deaminase toxin n=1 Tax=Amycolatopsis sp. cmx-8-4 TaxID=2790947 RepID=UPI00397B408C